MQKIDDFSMELNFTQAYRNNISEMPSGAVSCCTERYSGKRQISWPYILGLDRV